jgi:magnesium-transporting ATPase (P-type)
MDESGVTTGDMDLVVQSPVDKATIVRSQQASHDTLLIFIGDSTNDLLAMLQADVGITLGFAAESTFCQVCRQYGIELSPLSHFDDLLACKDHAKTKARSNQRVLFTANSWSEIHSVTLSTTVC